MGYTGQGLIDKGPSEQKLGGKEVQRAQKINDPPITHCFHLSIKISLLRAKIIKGQDIL